MDVDENNKDINPSDGLEIDSLQSISSKLNQSKTPDFNKESGSFFQQKTESGFKDLEEIDNPEIINLSGKNSSSIDNIEYENNEKFNPDNFINIPVKKNTDIQKTENEPILENNSFKKKPIQTAKEAENSQSVYDVPEETESKIEELKSLNEAENIEEFSEAEEALEIDDLEFLIGNIDKKNDKVAFPGKVNILSIDKKLAESDLTKTINNQMPQEQEEVFGIKRAEVFYNIDKKIYSSKHGTSKSLAKLRNLKNGFFLPGLVAAISFAFLLIAVPALSYYFKKTSNSTLEENLISDNSILNKIAKQKEEEARLAKLKLEEEKRNLEFEKTRIKTTINEELLKRQSEIENDYKKKMAELEKQGGTAIQLEQLKQQIEEEKLKSLESAKSEHDRKLDEQQKILSLKDKELKDADDKLKKAIENKDYEISKMTKDLEQKIKERDTEKENIVQKLKEINETNKKIKEFNQIIYQLITAAINEFKNGNKEQSLAKLDNLTKYYDSRLEFVMSNEDLKNKMTTDLMFVQTIIKLIRDTQNSSLYNDDLLKIINRFKKITEFYKNAETAYSQKNWQKSGEDYSKVLGEFEEINSSYNKIKDVERQIQNVKAADIYNKAIVNMKNQQYNVAITQLASVVKDTPLSDYSEQALNDIVRLSNSIAEASKNIKGNETARELFDRAKVQSNNNLYKEAIETYKNIIINYSYSDYINDSLKNLLALNDLLNSGTTQKGLKEFDNKIREDFRIDYNKFLEFSQKGDFKQAREYYFSALKNAFNIYTENSVQDFKNEEDKYILSMLENSKHGTDDNLLKQLEETKTQLTLQFNENLEKQKKQIENDLKNKYEAQIAELKQNQNKESQEQIKAQYDAQITKLNEELSKSLKKEDVKIEQDKIISQYEAQITKLKDDFTKTNKDQINAALEEQIAKLKQDQEIEKNKLLNDKINAETEKKSLESDKKKLEEDKKKLEDDYKKLLVKSDNKEIINELETAKKNYQEAISQKNAEIVKLNKALNDIDELQKKFSSKENELKIEKNNVARLKDQLYNLYKKYGELEQKYKKSSDSANDETLKRDLSDLQLKYKTLETELEQSRIALDIKKTQLEEKTNEEIKKQVDAEKQKITQEFEKQLTYIKNESISKSDIKKPAIESKINNKYFARIIEINGTSITFQFFSNELINNIVTGDKVKIIRYSQDKTGNKENVIGEIIVSSTDKNSLFGRGNITAETKQIIQINDLLKR